LANDLNSSNRLLYVDYKELEVKMIFDKTSEIHLGPKEYKIITYLTYKNVDVITKEEFEKLVSSFTLTREIIHQFLKKGIFEQLTKGVYYFSPPNNPNGGTLLQSLAVPAVLFPDKNYYIGYNYNDYGFTEQVFQAIHVLNTHYQYDRVIGKTLFIFKKISPRRLYGIEERTIANRSVRFSDKERTLVDLLYFPNPIGGQKEAFNVLKDQISNNKIDLDKFLNYTIQFPSALTRKRIGFFLEKLDVPLTKLGPLAESIRTTQFGDVFSGENIDIHNSKRWKVLGHDSQESREL
jgi:predicted transcriptional regulator of viral defense system